MIRLICMISLILLVGCTSEAKWEYYATQQVATLAADVALSTQDTWREQGQATQTAQALDLAIVNGLVAQTQQAQVVQATAQAQAATQAAATLMAQETADARRLAEQMATATEAARQTETAEARSQATAQAQAVETQRAWQATEMALQATATANAIQAQLFVAERTATATYAAAAGQMTATAAVAQGNAEATAVAAASVLANNAAQRDTITTEFSAWWVYAGPIIWVAVALVLIFAAYLLVYDLYKKYLDNRVIARGANGAAPVIITDGTVVAPDLMVLPNLNPSSPVYLPAAFHAQAAQDNAKVRAIQALQGSQQPARRMLASMSQSAPAPAVTIREPAIPERAAWDQFTGWQGPAFLLGVGADNQTVTFDPAHTPHLMVAATSGAGKSMTILRPLAAAALSRGYQVVLANDAGGDFAPLGSHPNLIRVGEDAGQIGRTLTALAAEVDRRSGLLKDAGVSTWSRLAPERRDGPAIMLILDELVALVRDADADVCRMIWRKLIKITSKGRKMSVVTVIGTTDPTERTLGPYGLTVRDNCSRVALRVLDASVSRVIVSQGGAEALGQDQFMARLSGGLQAGVAFHPEDEQLATYVRSQVTPKLSEPGWLLQPGPDVDSEEETDLERLRWFVEQNPHSSRNAMCQFLWKQPNAGAFSRKIDLLLLALERQNANAGAVVG